MDLNHILDTDDAAQPLIEPPSSPPPFLPPYYVPHRKRTRAPDHEDDSTPSDGPLFSSDPPDPSIDEYFQPRRKRQYRGTWWGEIAQDTPVEPAQQRAKTGFSRNMDSGVWMGSDVTEEELRSDETIPDEEATPRQIVPRVAAPNNHQQYAWPKIKLRPDMDSSSVRKYPAIPEIGAVRQTTEDAEELSTARAIQRAQAQLHHSLDNSKEDVHLR